ncbi:MAG: hypothetical protein PVI86_10055 [Phycisphaerae bacterium]|jgi:hypothetical protein
MGFGSNAIWTGTVTNPGNVGWMTEYAAAEQNPPGCTFDVYVNDSAEAVAQRHADAYNAQTGPEYSATVDPPGGRIIRFSPANVAGMAVNGSPLMPAGPGVTMVGDTGMSVKVFSQDV